MEVQVGSLWQYNKPRMCQHDRKLVKDYSNHIFRVVRPNAMRSELADSWVMCDINDGRILYMHHVARMNGDWTPVPDLGKK